MRQPSDAPIPPVPPLAVAPFPAAGEHFGSWIRRLATDNGFGTVGSLARHLSLMTLSPVSWERTWKRLDEATGIGRSRLDPLRMRMSDDDRSRLALIDGEVHQYGFLDRVHLRSCPSCLRQDGQLPMRFAMRHVTACPRHGLRLDDACACGRPRRIFDRHSLWRCPDCDLDAMDQPRVDADPRELLVTGIFLRPATCDRQLVPPTLLDETRSARASVIERLGNLSRLERDDGPSGSRHNISARAIEAADRTRRLADDREVVLAAADLLSDWPVGYAALIARLADRHPDRRAAKSLLRRFSSKAGHLALRSFVDHDRRVIPFAEAARVAALNDAVGYVPDEELVMRRTGLFERMPCTPSATVSTPRSNVDFVSILEFRFRLHLGGGRRIDDWFEGGLIGTVRHEDGAVLVRRTDFDDLLTRVASLPEGDGDDAEYLPSAVLNARRNGAYRQRFMLEDVMSGRIRSRATDDDAEGMRGRRLNRLDFDLRRMLCKTAIQVVADKFVELPEYLPVLWGIPMPTAAAVTKLRDEGRVRTLPTKRPSCHLVSVRDLVHVVQEDGAQRILDTSPAAIVAATGDWRLIVVGDLCAG